MCTDWSYWDDHLPISRWCCYLLINNNPAFLGTFDFGTKSGGSSWEIQCTRPSWRVGWWSQMPSLSMQPLELVLPVWVQSIKCDSGSFQVVFVETILGKNMSNAKTGTFLITNMATEKWSSESYSPLVQNILLLTRVLGKTFQINLLIYSFSVWFTSM